MIARSKEPKCSDDYTFHIRVSHNPQPQPNSDSEHKLHPAIKTHKSAAMILLILILCIVAIEIRWKGAMPHPFSEEADSNHRICTTSIGHARTSNP
eukprot:3933828-Rhodomonas_salina.5